MFYCGAPLCWLYVMQPLSCLAGRLLVHTSTLNGRLPTGEKEKETSKQQVFETCCKIYLINSETLFSEFCVCLLTVAGKCKPMMKSCFALVALLMFSSIKNSWHIVEYTWSVLNSYITAMLICSKGIFAIEDKWLQEWQPKHNEKAPQPLIT